MGCWIFKDHKLTLGVMGQCYSPCLELGPQKKVLGFKPTGVQVKALPALCH
jgi:hypothetical protein